ncbi:MAG: coniferyl-alcohol dehydrogenase [Actinomycetota bacterium]|nr:coniferyl-alcohol dehydrogenase [Actinomycetota bacterium]
MTNEPHQLPTPDDPWGYRDRRVVVTGAASGMGKAASEILVGLGAEVIGLDIQPVEVDGVAQYVQLDLADPAAVDAAADAVAGQVDALFNCAGIPGTAEPRKVLAINFAGMRQLTERLIPRMPAGSAICCIGSTAAVNWPYHVDAFLELLAGGSGDPVAAVEWLEARVPQLGYAYDVSKEAVNVYAAWRSIGLNELDIRINCINPGGTFTPASREFTKAVKSKDGGAEMIANWPKLLGRMARPDEQAWPMVFLNSRFASFVNGASLFVDAGLIAGMVTQQHHPAMAAGMFWSKPVPSAAVGR